MTLAKSVVLKEPFDTGVPGPEHFDIVESEVCITRILATIYSSYLVYFIGSRSY